jgi:hypothetical protein
MRPPPIPETDLFRGFLTGTAARREPYVSALRWWMGGARAQTSRTIAILHRMTLVTQAQRHGEVRRHAIGFPNGSP